MVTDGLDPVIMLTHSTRPWASDLHHFVADHGGALVRGYAVSPESAVDATYDVLFVDDVTSLLDDPRRARELGSAAAAAARSEHLWVDRIPDLIATYEAAGRSHR